MWKRLSVWLIVMIPIKNVGTKDTYSGHYKKEATIINVNGAEDEAKIRCNTRFTFSAIGLLINMFIQEGIGDK